MEINDYGRTCLVNKLGDNPGDFGKDILGSDCALDMKNIDAVCHNLKRFFEWAYEDCNGGADDAPRGNEKLEHLENRCKIILDKKEEIHAITAKSLVDDIERTNREIIEHNIKMQKDGKAAGRYGPRSSFATHKKKQKGKKPAKKVKPTKKPAKKIKPTKKSKKSGKGKKSKN
jgi:hypothetical protein